MANVGTGAAGKTFIGTGVLSSPTFATIGTNSGLTNHGILLGQGNSPFVAVGPTATTGQVLQNNAGANPSYSTATYPSSTTINRLLYSSANNVVSELVTSNNGILITSATGVPSLLAAGTTGQVLTATTGSPPSWAAPATSGTVTSVSGTANQVAVANPTTTPVISLIGPYTPATYTAHGVLVGEGTSSIVAVGPTATTGQVLQNNAGADPTYSTATYPSSTTINRLLYSSANNVVSELVASNSSSLASSSSGVPTWVPMTNGQLIIGNTGGTPAAATPSSIGGNFIVGAGSLNYIPANYEPGFSNIGFTYSAGTFTVNGFDGTALSATNPGYVTVPHPSTPGRYLTIAITANQTFTDGSGGTLAGQKFGLPYGGTDVSWAVNMPMFLYAVVKSDGTAIAFMISRNAAAVTSPAAASIGQSGSVVNVGQTDMFSLASITAANYASQPCIYIGCFQVRYTAGTPSFYTVQALTAGVDGPGLNYETKQFTMPTGANGAATGSYYMANGGTAPIWSAQSYFYIVKRDGFIRVLFAGATSLSTAGVGSVNMRFILPYAANVQWPTFGGFLFVNNSAGFSNFYSIMDTSGNIYSENTIGGGNAKAQNSFVTATNAVQNEVNLLYLAIV